MIEGGHVFTCSVTSGIVPRTANGAFLHPLHVVCCCPHLSQTGFRIAPCRIFPQYEQFTTTSQCNKQLARSDDVLKIELAVISREIICMNHRLEFLVKKFKVYSTDSTRGTVFISVLWGWKTAVEYTAFNFDNSVPMPPEPP